MRPDPFTAALAILVILALLFSAGIIKADIGSGGGASDGESGSLFEERHYVNSDVTVQLDRHLIGENQVLVEGIDTSWETKRLNFEYNPATLGDLSGRAQLKVELVVNGVVYDGESDTVELGGLTLDHPTETRSYSLGPVPKDADEVTIKASTVSSDGEIWSSESVNLEVPTP